MHVPNGPTRMTSFMQGKYIILPHQIKHYRDPVCSSEYKVSSSTLFLKYFQTVVRGTLYCPCI